MMIIIINRGCFLFFISVLYCYIQVDLIYIYFFLLLLKFYCLLVLFCYYIIHNLLNIRSCFNFMYRDRKIKKMYCKNLLTY